MENIIIADENDNYIGLEEKEKCHNGDGILHRAFLAMVFNKRGELLLARRSRTKKLWPGFWDGTVASHLHEGEDYEAATRRRLEQEIGLVTDNVEYLFKFYYKAVYKNLGTEHEICAVLNVTGIEPEEIEPNREEIDEIRFVDPCELMRELGDDKNKYTPWLIHAMQHQEYESVVKG